MTRLCRESSCSYLGRSYKTAVACDSALVSNGAGDLSEVSRGHISALCQEARSGKDRTSAKKESHLSRWRRSS